jgi:hypothetical protein
MDDRGIHPLDPRRVMRSRDSHNAAHDVSVSPRRIEPIDARCPEWAQLRPLSHMDRRCSSVPHQQGGGAQGPEQQENVQMPRKTFARPHQRKSFHINQLWSIVTSHGDPPVKSLPERELSSPLTHHVPRPHVRQSRPISIPGIGWSSRAPRHEAASNAVNARASMSIVSGRLCVPSTFHRISIWIGDVCIQTKSRGNDASSRVYRIAPGRRVRITSVHT